MNLTLAQPLTFHAPPGRLPAGAIQQQAAALGGLGGLARLLDCMPDFVMILNEQRQIIFGNQRLRDFACGQGAGELLGLRPGELLGCRQAAAAPAGCGTGVACRTCGAVNAILAGLDGGHINHECRISTPTSVAYDLRIWASPFQWPTGHYVLVIAVDIGNEKRRQVLERIFFHDILNTAGGVYGLAELLQQDPESIAVLKDDLHETAEALVNEIHAQRLLLQAEQNQLPVSFARTDARRVLETAVKAYRHHALAKGRIIALAPGPAVSLKTDEALLLRVMGNLLKNALEASQVGDQVTLGVEEKSATVVLWCHNPQVIPAAIQLQLFQRSFSTKGSGRGIGTYSIRLLTERYLGGQASFESSPAAGTRFEVTLPREAGVSG